MLPTLSYDVFHRTVPIKDIHWIDHFDDEAKYVPETGHGRRSNNSLPAITVRLCLMAFFVNAQFDGIFC